MIDFDQLLGRAPISADNALAEAFFTDAQVLVTGAGGSIGSELCRQISRCKPRSLVLFDRAEDNLFRIHRELPQAVSCIGDVCDRARVEAIFSKYRPEIVLHAAAYKHVPMMEDNASEAIRNNVDGTRTVADTSSLFEVHKFVLVSTDKAVNPSSVMGATKRLAEMYVRAMDARSRTRFTTVRFGNVLGSTGSVVPIWLEQIAKGGPVTVTHPDMTRYFMTIPEACHLVLQAAAMGSGGEVLVLDMGAPIKIVDLAQRLIEMIGGVAKVEFTGVRPGEKLVEELSREGLYATKQNGILVGHPPKMDLWEVLMLISHVNAAADVKSKLLEVVS